MQSAKPFFSLRRAILFHDIAFRHQSSSSQIPSEAFAQRNETSLISMDAINFSRIALFSMSRLMEATNDSGTVTSVALCAAVSCTNLSFVFHSG
jgi:hypothetical protein